MKKIDNLTILIIISAALLYGITHVYNKFNLNSGMDPFSYTFFLTFFSLFFMFIFGILEKKNLKKEISSLKKRDIIDLAIIGVVVSGIASTVRMFGLDASTATNGGIFQGISVISTVIFSFLLLNERLSKKSIFLILVVIFGAFLLSTNGELIIPKQGDLLLMFSLILPGFTNTYAKGLMSRLNSYIITFGRIFFGFLSILIIGLFIGIDFNMSLFEFALIALAGLILSSRIRIFYESINRTNASYGATFLLLGALLTPFIAFVFLGETLSLIQILGAALILLAAYFLISYQRWDK